MLLGFFGLILHCSSLNSDPRMAGCQNCCYGWGILDCFPASLEACFALVLVFVVIFAILGIAYGFLAATMAIQRIWQRHYHILTKRELTKVRFCQCNEYIFYTKVEPLIARNSLLEISTSPTNLRYILVLRLFPIFWEFILLVSLYDFVPP